MGWKNIWKGNTEFSWGGVLFQEEEDKEKIGYKNKTRGGHFYNLLPLPLPNTSTDLGLVYKYFSSFCCQ